MDAAPVVGRGGRPAAKNDEMVCLGRLTPVAPCVEDDE
jgi:hypothetical protein